jgi:hypothetical protein
VEGRGVPLSIVVTGANRHDVSQLKAVLGNKIAEPIMESQRENLCADAGYSGEKPRKIMISAGYKPHVCPCGEEKREKENNPFFKACRWVVSPRAPDHFNNICSANPIHKSPFPGQLVRRTDGRQLLRVKCSLLTFKNIFFPFKGERHEQFLTLLVTDNESGGELDKIPGPKNKALVAFSMYFPF